MEKWHLFQEKKKKREKSDIATPFFFVQICEFW